MYNKNLYSHRKVIKIRESSIINNNNNNNIDNKDNNNFNSVV